MARKSPDSFGTLNTFGTHLAVSQSKLRNLMIMTVMVMTMIVNDDEGDDDDDYIYIMMKCLSVCL